MRILTAHDQRQVAHIGEVIDTVGQALAAYSSGKAIAPVRLSIPIESAQATSLFMPAYVESTNSLGVKLVSVFPNNKHRGKATIYGLMALADAETGEPLALLEASYLTVLRTGAASGLATKLLAREDASILAVIGTGAQARGLVEAIMHVRSLTEIRLYNRNLDKARLYAAELQREYGEQVYIRVMQTADLAVDGADIIATATNADTPVISAAAVKEGAHVNAIGSYKPTMQELPSQLLTRADRVIVESRAAALEESGDLAIPIREGLFTERRVDAELGEIVMGAKSGRERKGEVTVFKSVGLAVMDVAVAKLLYDRAVQAKLGTELTLF